MWMPTAAEHGLRPTIEPLFQATATTLQRAVPRMPPPPGLTPPAPAIPALMSLTSTSGPTLSVTSTSTTCTRDTTTSPGPSANSSSQRESQGRGSARIQGSTQVGSSQAGTQQSSQSGRWRHTQSQGCSQSQACSQSQMCSPSQSQSQRRTQTTKPLRVTGKCGPQLTPPSPLQQPNRPPPREMAAKKWPWTPLRPTPGMEQPLLISGGGPCPFDDEGPDMPKSEGWKVDYSTFFRYFLRGHYPQIPLAQLRAIYEPVLRYLGTRQE